MDIETDELGFASIDTGNIWFEKKYPKANVDWSKYEIHHIRPLKYGGSNKISNGIAITIAQHKKLNTWWQNY